MSFFAFVAQYYEERLHFYERLDLTRCSEAALLDIAGEASALHKFLTDILEEGYTTTVNRLVGQTDAINRLQQFLSTVLSALGRSLGTGTLLPLPGPDPTAPAHHRDVRRRSDLRVASVSRPSRSPVRRSSGHCPLLRDADQQQRWQAKTQVLMTEMVAFLHWICARLAQPIPVVPVPLLRDTLADPLGTDLATTLRRANTRITACSSLGGNLPTSVGTAETSMVRWAMPFIACLWKSIPTIWQHYDVNLPRLSTPILPFQRHSRRHAVTTLPPWRWTARPLH